MKKQRNRFYRHLIDMDYRIQTMENKISDLRSTLYISIMCAIIFFILNVLIILFN